jgi:hypothetical protein
MLAHKGEPFAARFEEPTFKISGVRHDIGEGKEEFEPDIWPSCSYCGSFTVEDTLKFLQTSGVHYSGSDWKYGWPHKFYISNIPCPPYQRIVSSTHQGGKITNIVREESITRSGKFYSAHLLDAIPEQMEEWNIVAAPLLGITFEQREGILRYRAPTQGYQTWGDVP